MKNKETMTSRERVIKAVRHEPVDRMPIDLGSTTATSISAFAYWNLREYLGLSTENIEITDMVQFTPRVTEDILKRFHCDCMVLQIPWSRTHHWNPRGKYDFVIPQTAQPVRDREGNWHVEYNGSMRMPAGGYFFDGAWLKLEDREEEEVIRLTAGEAERIYKETDYYTTLPGFPGYFETNPDWLCELLLEPEKVMAQNQRRLDAAIKKAEKVIKSMGSYIQAVRISSDMGTQNGPWCDPAIVETAVAPYYKKFCGYIHENSDLKVHLHCCGSIKPLIPILIDCGIDVLNPVQISANDMDPQELKHSFGDKITFWGGGCDTQNVLNRGTPAEVAEHVRKLVSIFKPGAGFVFNQVHNIMGDIKPENIVAMLDTAYEESFC